MLYELKNDQLTVTFNDMGGVLHSVRREDCEYLWQGNPEYWNGRAPILFPICGRLIDGKYTYGGKTFEMKIHGFARFVPFETKIVSDKEIVFTLTANEETLAQYPFPFVLTISYRLEGSEIISDIVMKNIGDTVMPCTVGAHPGFNIPLDGKGEFTDFYLEFGESCSPDQLVFSDTCFQTGKKTAFPLVDGKCLPLRHTLFDNDAIFLARMADSVTLKSEKTERFVRLSYPKMPYLGIWHKPRTEAPYVCIEPWCGLPSFDGVVDDLATKSDMFRLQPGEEKVLTYSIYFG